MTLQLSHSETDFSLVKLSGSDAQRYLQGRVSQDIAKLDSSPKATFVLSPQGKLLGMASVLKTSEGYELLVLGGNVEEFIEGLLQFKVADDVEATVLSKEVFISSTQTGDAKPFSWPSVKSAASSSDAEFFYSLESVSYTHLTLPTICSV